MPIISEQNGCRLQVYIFQQAKSINFVEYTVAKNR